MPDVLTREQRSLNMRRVRGKDTGPEVFFRKGLHALGYRYNLHVRRLPGCPDLCLPKHRTVVFVHGCFWHGHQCPTFRWPRTRRSFWSAKIQRNRLRDDSAVQSLLAEGWQILIVWECALRGPHRRTPADVYEMCERFLATPLPRVRQIAGRTPRARGGLRTTSIDNT